MIEFSFASGGQGDSSPEKMTKKKMMQMVHSETILADSVPVFFLLNFIYKCISKFGHKSDMSTRIGI